jgi:hypothetical protein
MDRVVGATAPLEADGSFVFGEVGIPATPYRIQLYALPSGFYIKEARLGGVDVLNEFASFSRSGNLEIVVSSRVGQVTGMVVREESQPKAGMQIVLVPDTLRNRFDLYKTAKTDGSGRFSLPNIAPGDYKLFAWERVEAYAYMDAEFLAPFELQGKPVHVGELSEQNVEVQAIPASDAP